MRILFFFAVSFITITSFNAQGLLIEEVNPDKHEVIKRQRADVIPKIASVKKYAPHTLYQLYSTCVAHSIASARTIIYARNNSILDKDKITSYLFSPHWIYYNNKSADDNECSMGLSLANTILSLADTGMPYMAYVEYPEYFPFTQKPLCSYYPPSISDDKLNATDYTLDKAYLLKNLEDVKLSISKGMPVVFGMQVPKSFKNAVNQELWVPNLGDQSGLKYGHAILIVGYDDYKHGGAVEILNSWGEDWGKGGYIWIKYTDLLKYITSQVFALDADDTIRFGSSQAQVEDPLIKRDKVLSSSIDSMTLSNHLLDMNLFNIENLEKK